LDVASDTEVVLWDAPGGLEYDLELFFDIERVFGEHLLDGDLASFPED
jgi:hypothetical protein